MNLATITSTAPVLVIFLVVCLISRWWVSRPDPWLPVYFFWTRSKAQATALYLATYLLLLFDLPGAVTEVDAIDLVVWGLAPLYPIYFPELNLMYRTRLARDDLLPVNAASALGWIILSVWALFVWISSFVALMR